VLQNIPIINIGGAATIDTSAMDTTSSFDQFEAIAPTTGQAANDHPHWVQLGFTVLQHQHQFTRELCKKSVSTTRIELPTSTPAVTQITATPSPWTPARRDPHSGPAIALSGHNKVHHDQLDPT
jgi:hypothetical protein